MPLSKEPIKVLDCGFVRLVDTMGDDEAIVDAARVSYANHNSDEARPEKSTRRLIRYLMRNWHCYTPEMEVLTIKGWRRWDECEPFETFLVPNPSTRTYTQELLKIKKFDYDDEIQIFKNSRMSYRVTSEHKMYFRKRNQAHFGTVEAENMSHWGHFDPIMGYTLYQNTKIDPLGQLIGFILGDGSFSCSGIEFHLKKPRKLAYLRAIADSLDIKLTERASHTHRDAVVFRLHSADCIKYDLNSIIDMPARSHCKRLLKIPDEPDVLHGIFDGLVNSDGHINTHRNNRIEFSSVSKELASTFETLATYFGYDAHFISPQDNYRVITASEGRVSLEARPQYFGTERYTGEVYCTTTSNGLLMVRGGPNKYAFVCGNSSPIEQVEIKLHFKAPIMVARQILRHRTAAPNEVSGRYTILSGEFYIPAPEQICYQSDDNKQGRSGPLPLEEALQWQDKLLNECDKAYAAYTEAADRGMAKETARMMLPVNVYTEWYWKIDGHNLLHFLRLRLHEHAQWETRQYGEAIASIVKQWIPLTWEAFEDYRLYSYTLSRMEKEVVSSLISSIPEIELRKLLRENGCVKSEIDEFIKAMGQDTK